MEFFSKARERGWTGGEIVTDKFQVRRSIDLRRFWAHLGPEADVSRRSWGGGSSVNRSWVETYERVKPELRVRFCTSEFTGLKFRNPIFP
jgi:hypothetical protein